MKKETPSYSELLKENQELRKLLSVREKAMSTFGQGTKVYSNKFDVVNEKDSKFVILTNIEGKMIYSNRKLSELNKLSEGSWDFKGIHILKNRINDEAEYEKMVKTINQGKTWGCELCNEGKDGEDIWEEICITPILNEKEDIQNFIISIENITSRKKIENALKESENKYRLLTESIQDVVIQVSPMGEVLYMSPSMSNLLKYEAKIAGKEYTIFDYFYIEEEKIKAQKFFEKIVKEHKSGVFEFTYKPFKDLKKPFPVEVSIQPIVEKGELKTVLLVLRDISERKEAERIHREDKARFQALSEASFEAIFLSINGYGVEANEAAMKMFGYNREEIKGMFGTDIIAPESKELVKKNMLSNYSKPYDAIAMRKDGTKFHAEFQGKSFEYKGKKVRVSSVRDISERKKNEELLKKREKELLLSNKTKDKFFSIIAHDLKAPFSSMLGFSDLLVENFDDYEKEEQKEIIETLHKGIHKTYSLLNNLLIWSKTQSNRIEFNPERVNLFLLANTEVSFLQEQAKKKSIKITNKIPKNRGILADKMMLSTVIRNLLSNAIKFTHKKGNISIGSDIIIKNGETFVELYVKDNGVGISKERQKVLFNIGEWTTTKGTEKEVGTGLGLSLCKEFVEKHKGELSFESELGKGTVFYVKIPF